MTIRGRMRAGGGLLAVVAVVAAACGDDGSTPGEVLSEGARDLGAEIVLEPVDAEMPDAFTGNLDLVADLGGMVDGFGQRLGAGLEDAPATRSSDQVEGELAGQTSRGTAPGLYGGTQNHEVCDVDQLVAFLTDPANSAQAEAWAGVQGITPEEIPDYIDGLTPVRLRLDTRVTNHGFAEGQATPFQSILQAGTAVLVDDEGVPRAKCFCGNPLSEPEPVAVEGQVPADAEQLIANVDEAWEGFDPAQVVKVDPGDQVQELDVYDLETGDIFKRPVGSDGTEDRPADEQQPDDNPPPQPGEEPGDPPPSDDPPPDPERCAQMAAEAAGGEEIASVQVTESACIVTFADGRVMEFEM